MSFINLLVKKHYSVLLVLKKTETGKYMSYLCTFITPLYLRRLSTQEQNILWYACKYNSLGLLARNNVNAYKTVNLFTRNEDVINVTGKILKYLSID